MNFALTEDQIFFQQNVAKFVDREIIPKAAEIDQKDEFPWDLWHKISSLGYLGLRYPESVGGMDADNVTAALFYEEITRGSVGFAQGVIMNMLMGTDLLFRFGSEAIKERCFMPAIKGEKVASICFTEEQSGSDLNGTQTRAKKQGNSWVINGKKTWITNGPAADFVTVLTTIDPSLGAKGLTFFLVEKGTPGFYSGQEIPKLGCRGPKTGELVFEDVIVSEENMLGGEGKALATMEAILDQIRVMTGAMALGISEAAYKEAIAYARHRTAFGKSISNYQLIRAKFADMAAKLEAARLMVHKSAWMIDEGLGARNNAAMAKVFAVEACLYIVDEVTRIHGAYGFAEEYNAQRYFRDARFLLYGGGTHEILRNFVGRNILERG